MARPEFFEYEFENEYDKIIKQTEIAGALGVLPVAGQPSGGIPILRKHSAIRNPRPAFHLLPSIRPKSCFLQPGPHILAVSAGVEIRYKIGNERLVKVTERAAAKLSQLLTRQGRPQGALRVAVIGGGCSGLQYKMDLVDGPANRDILVESNRVRVVVDPKTALFVSGSSVDFSEDLQKGGFKVTNPNAVAHCSCGESFSA
jgi:iron-sulfur cluster assembly accessory protein